MTTTPAYLDAAVGARQQGAGEGGSIPRTRDKSEAWEEFALAAFLVLCFLLAFLKDVFPVLDKGLQAAVFAATFFILKQIRDLKLEIRYGGGEVLRHE